MPPDQHMTPVAIWICILVYVSAYTYKKVFSPKVYRRGLITSGKYGQAKRFLSDLTPGQVMVLEAFCLWGVGYELVYSEIGAIRQRVFMETVAPVIRAYPDLIGEVLAEKICG